MSHVTLRGLVVMVVVVVVVLIGGGGATGSASERRDAVPQLQAEPTDVPAGDTVAPADPAVDADDAGVVAEATPGAGDVLPGSPMLFIENVGQWPEAARFQLWGGPAGTMWLAEDAIWITVSGRGEASQTDASPLDATAPGMPRPYASDPQGANVQRENVQRAGANIKVTFPGANPHPRLEPVELLDTKVSYLLGDDPAQWRSEVPVWGGVRYVDLYAGVDLVVGAAGDERTLWALEAQEGADTSAVKVSVEGAEGAAPAGGLLRLAAADREIMLPLPGADFSYAVNESAIEGRGAEQSIAPEVDAQAVSSAGNPADLLYSTFLGGSHWDSGRSIAVDGSGRAYVTGETWSTDFPTTPGAFDRTYNGSGLWDGDAFVARLNASGSALEYATFLGGSAGDAGYGIAVDPAGRAYVTGLAGSGDFPTTAGAFDLSYNGDGYDNPGDAFVLRLNARGSALEYATFVGGSDGDSGSGIDVDASGRAFVTGGTNSSDFPFTPGAFDTSYSGGDWDRDAFVVRLNANGSGLEYATFLGGSERDQANGIAVDASGRAYVTGYTWSSNFPTTSGAFDRSSNGWGDAFVVRFNASGSALEYATFLGGNGFSDGNAIVVDASGRAYVTGGTRSSDFPTTPDAFDRSYNGRDQHGGDVFVVRLKANGTALEYATYLGGSRGDVGTGIAVDASGRAYVTGGTYSSDFPFTPGALDTSYNESYCVDMDGERVHCPDAFAVRLNATGSAVEYATFLGGTEDDWGTGIAVDASVRAYVAGHTWSSDFPTTPGAFDRSHAADDAYVAKLGMGVTTKSFQNKVAPSTSYTGCIDTYVAEAAPAANFGTATSVIASGSDPAGTGKDNWALLKWDLSSISGWVKSATLSVNVTDHAAGQTYELYEVLDNWSETAVTWANKPARGTTVLGVVAPTKTSGALVARLNAAGLAVVQKWLDTPATNNGLYLMDSANTDTLIFDSSSQATATLRPRLTVIFTPPVITKKPWVQNITATAANVLWETDISGRGTLNFRVKGVTTWMAKTVLTTLVSEKWQAKAVLTGLTTNTIYEYRVRASADSAWKSIATFVTAAAGPAADVETAPEDGTGSGSIFLPLLRR